MVDELLAFDQFRPNFSPGPAESLRRRMEEALTPCRWCRLREDCDGPGQLPDQED